MDSKQCVKCLVTKPLSEFSFKRPKNRKPGFQPRCKCCAKEDTKEWRQQQSEERLKDLYYKRTYGMSVQDFNFLLQQQKHSCKICGKSIVVDGISSNRAVVDHCHTTGRVRGILCNECNRGLGYFHDNINSLENAIDYLRSDNALPKEWCSPV